MIKRFKLLYSFIICLIPVIYLYSHNSHNFSVEEIDKYNNEINFLSPENKVDKIIKDMDNEISPLTYEEAISIFVKASKNKKAKDILKNHILKPDGYSVTKEIILESLSEIEPTFTARKKLLLSIYNNKNAKEWSRGNALITLSKDKEFIEKDLLKNLLKENIGSKKETKIIIKAWRNYAGRNELSYEDRTPNIYWLTQLTEQNSMNNDFPNYIYTLFKVYQQNNNDALNYLIKKYQDCSQKKEKTSQNFDAQYRIISTILDLTNGWEELIDKPELLKMVINYSFGDNESMNPIRPNIALLMYHGYEHKIEFGKYLDEKFSDMVEKIGREDMLKLLYILRFRKKELLQDKAFKLIQESLNTQSVKERYLAYKLTPRYAISKEEAIELLQPYAKNESDIKCRKHLMMRYSSDIFH